MIGSGREYGGLYLLDMSAPEGRREAFKISPGPVLVVGLEAAN